MPISEDLAVPTLGPCRIDSPLAARGRSFVDEAIRVRRDHEVGPDTDPATEASFEKAGPRQQIFFDPGNTTAAFVTCGGLCPGINNVLRSGFLELTHNYGVHNILGIRNGYAGLNPDSGFEPVELTPRRVHDIHHLGGTILGSSRGPQPPEVVVDFLESRRIDLLFCIGGDGTLRGTHAIQQEVQRRGLPKAVVGIPKTIDNDIPYVWVSFGYLTALEAAGAVLRGAHVEATGAPNGIALVKLMGRNAGYIAGGATIVSQDVNFVLVPEVAAPLDGEDGLLAALERRILDRGHAVIVVAEGAGQHLFERAGAEHDASGNVRYEDIGLFLRDRIKAYFAGREIPINLKYIDPSYVIRSTPANAWDRIFTDRLARNAVHAGMAGKTGVMVGFWNQRLIHVPLEVATTASRRLSLKSDMWNAVLATTGQPDW